MHNDNYITLYNLIDTRNNVKFPHRRSTLFIVE